MKNRIKSIMKKAFLLGTMIQGLFTTLSVNAGALGDSKLVSGTKNLISDGTTVLIGLEAAVVVFLFIKNLVQFKTGEEEEKPKHKKNAKNVLILGVLVITASGTIGVLFSYFV